MDRIDLLKIFVRTVETGSFTSTARSFSMARSSVSTAIRDLELRIGTRLLARTTRTVTVTPDGRAFYDHAVRLIEDMEETENLFRQKDSRPRGSLRVDLPGRIGRLIVAPALPGFLSRYPEIDLQVGVTDRTVNLLEDGVDCAVRVGPVRDSALIARPLGLLGIVTVASPDYLDRHGTPQHPDDLSAHLAVHYASPTTGRTEDWEWTDGTGTHTRSMRARVTVNSAEALIACATAGLGLIQVPAYDIRDQLRTGVLREVLPDYTAEALPLTLLCPYRRHLSARLRVFTDWLAPLLIRETAATPIEQDTPHAADRH